MKKRLSIRAIPLFVAVLAAIMHFPVSVQSATLEVGTGKPYATIQSAIADAHSRDTVLVDDGKYIENINFLGKAITVKSVNGAIKTIIDGNLNGTVVTFSSSEGSNSVLDGFLLTNAKRTAVSSFLNGGGIYCYSASPSIKNCIIDGNQPDYGGGIYCELSSPLIVNCTITNNWAMSAGGGIFLKSSSPSISKCIISHNGSSGGAGLSLLMSSPSITNCFIVRNGTNYSFGGGISCHNSSPKITNCTISDNSVSTMPSGFEVGGGMYCDDASSPTVLNSIFWGNVAKNEIDLSEDSSINITYSDIEGGWEGSGNIDADPLYIYSNDNVPDYHLTDSSPCIDKGTSEGAPADDIDNDPRPQGAGFDMGADEVKVILKDSDGDGPG